MAAQFLLQEARLIGRRHPKPKPRSETHRVGRRIRVKEVRIIDEKGEMLGIMPTHEAMARAEEAGLQLVEVNPKASPPVCKIMDYGKFKYEVSKRDREAKKHHKSTELKEVKYRPKTHDHDFDFKTKHARRFIDDGDKVKLVVQFRGREITHPETGRSVLDRVVAALADVATVIQVPQMEGNRMNMVLAPKVRRESSPRPKSPRPPGEASPGIDDTDDDDDDVDDVDGTDDTDDETSEAEPSSDDSDQVATAD